MQRIFVSLGIFIYVISLFPVSMNCCKLHTAAGSVPTESLLKQAAVICGVCMQKELSYG